MKRLLFVPVLFAAGVGWGWWSGYGWPILCTGARCFARADAPDYEPEVL